MSMNLSKAARAAAVVAAVAACAIGAACDGTTAPIGGEDGGPEAGTSCAAGQTLCSGTCTDTTKDPASCGSCGHACGGTEACQAGKCVSACGTGSTDCNGSCTSTDTDNANCGACGTKCAQGEVCANGKCGTTCAASEKLCTPDGGAAYCANTGTDNANCGSCGNACPQGEVCSGGKCGATCLPNATLCTPDGGTPYCADTTSDNANCGSCGNPCPAHQACSSSQCACVPTNPAECNGVDNNCNNVVDEGCPTGIGLDTNATPSLTSPLFGDTGGTAWANLCPQGQSLVGIGGDNGGNIDQFHGICGTLAIDENTQTNPYTYTVTVGAGQTLPNHGINGTTTFTIMCPANQVVSRIDGYYDTVDRSGTTGYPTVGVHQLSVYCSSLTAVGQPTSYSLVASTPALAGTATSNYNLSLSSTFSFFCPGSDMIGGVSGRSGYWTDALQFECFTPSLTLRP